MLQLRNLLGLASMLCLGVALHAQTTVTTSGGTTSVVPVYTGSSTLGNSPISISGNNVGIGTTNPGSLLELSNSGAVTAGLRISNGTGHWQLGAGIVTANDGAVGLYDINAGLNRLVINSSGKVGIGTIVPSSQFHLDDPTNGGPQITLSAPQGGNPGIVFRPFQVPSLWTNPAQAAITATDNNWSANMHFFTKSPGAITNPLVERLTIQNDGNVGIGTTLPGARLEVSGSVKLTSGIGGSLSFSDDTVQSTAWTGVLSGGDYAESVNVSGDRNTYEPGDVLVIDSASEGKFLKSSTPYATTVTGIYSTKPGVTGRRQRTSSEHMKEEVPMAMTGIVPTKVSAENGPIKPGDLLVTSSKPGYAMKGTDRSQMLGAVIGKAIGHLDTGTGLIETVVTLQ
jgi:hypothetical protein